MRSKKHPATTHIPKGKAGKFPAFPKSILVLHVQDGEDSWYEVNENLDILSDGDMVGIYELREVKRVRVTTELYG